MKILNNIVILLIGCLICQPIYATDISSLVDMVMANNPTIQIERKRNAAELLSLQSENTLADLEVEFSHLWGQKGIGNKLGIEISQSFDWPGAYKARTEANKSVVKAMDLLAVANESAVRLEVRQVLLDIVNARMKMNLYRDVLAEIDSLSVIVNRDVANKAVSILDGNKLRIERIALARKYAEALDTYHNSCFRLTELNGGKSCEEVVSQITDFPSITDLRPLEDYYTEATMFNPEIRYRESLSAANQAKAHAANLDLYPGFSVGLRHELEQGDRFNGFSISMSLPFFSGRGKKKSVLLEGEAQRMESEQLAVVTRARVNNDYKSAERLLNDIRQYSSIIESVDNLRLLRKAFEARLISVLDYISDLIYFTDATSDYYDLKYRYHLQLASLERYSGYISR